MPLPLFPVNISPLNRDLAAALQEKIDQKTKPQGALGRLEPLALQLGLIQQTLIPELKQPHILVCAGDHGAAKAGVSAYPQDVTWQMVENFLAGGAAINVLARQAHIQLVVADAGVNHDFGSRPGLFDAKVANGTNNYIEEAAMSKEECLQAMENGRQTVKDIASKGCNVLGFGEMGIGNTASASLLTHCLTNIDLEQCVGRGTGLDDAGLLHKHQLLSQALQRWSGNDPLEVLMQFGGFEMAMLCGAMLAAAEAGMVLIIDGFIVTSVVLVAAALVPELLDYCVFAHCSEEPGHRLQLQYLGVRPLLDMDLRLGEGTGAALAYPLIKSTCAWLAEMASFASAGVSEKIRGIDE